MRARPWIVALVVLAACGSSVGESAAASVAESAGSTAVVTRCGPAGARTLAANRRVRVYALHQIVYGCSVARGRHFRLGHASRALAEARVGPVAVAGDLAAYGLQSFGVDTVSASVVVRRLTDGTIVKELGATRAVGAEAFESIGSVAVLANGAVAWIGSEHSIVGHRSAIEVHTAGAGGDRVLDSGPNIVPASLRLHGARLSWVDGGATRHATLR
ncbi:MAG TPA: hypothetical protein VJ741_17325 [Solirubrobacteraceae bacterium]|nr:hypothetical protein [Solirubrobacteraceae bacterium]